MPLSVIDARTPFQPQYQAAVTDLVTFLRGGLQDNLHSVYVYGSVARKTARPNYSNLDVVVVTHNDFSANRSTLFNTIKWRFQKSHPHVTELNIKSALTSEVVSLDSLFSWGFLLRHCAVCVYGDDLSECFGDYEPSWEIAKHWNMDLHDWLAAYRLRIGSAASSAEQIKAQQAIAKKMLRASYSLVMYRDKNWFDEPIDCGRQFLHYHPEKRREVERLAILLSGQLVAKRSVVGLMDEFGSWLTKQYQRTEFKIG
ncbi:nucleotidyltransferase domain-containing protein [Vibrio sp.]|uniref:nucleotidyltransferase domain-containing protein n=1 Tax=Vibrio sp. TaxID=678 RepID=UPI003D106586